LSLPTFINPQGKWNANLDIKRTQGRKFFKKLDLNGQKYCPIEMWNIPKEKAWNNVFFFWILASLNLLFLNYVSIMDTTEMFNAITRYIQELNVILEHITHRLKKILAFPSPVNQLCGCDQD
jgi:hypothetical protein